MLLEGGRRRMYSKRCLIGECVFYVFLLFVVFFFFFQAEDGIRDFCLSRGLGAYSA